ncbi:MAG: hemolysin family protein [Dysgonamonadaceae bacterium]|nr:hemolysin family protein [Dysgonamonadaceae bacterium]
MINILFIIILILVNGFFALSEIALVSSKKSRLETERKKGHKGARTALKLQSDSDRFLSAIQVGITLIGIINGVYGGVTIAAKVAPFLKEYTLLAPYAENISLVLVVFIITYVSIVIGELVPKTIALNNPEKIAVKVAIPIHYFSKAFYPFVLLLSKSTQVLTQLLGIDKKSDVVSEMELRTMIKTATTQGVIEKGQDIIHERVFYFSDKRARHLMTHRTDVDWIDISDSQQTIIDEVLNSRHSKLIACQDSLDNFVGIVNVKEVLVELFNSKDISIQEFVIEPLIVPSTIRAQRVLDLFKKEQQYVAIVVDEYGNFEGIITLHDIIENLVGDMPQEDENIEPDILIREDKSALVNGDASIELMSQFIEGFVIDFEEIDYSTIAGFVLENINKIPQLGDKFEYEDLIFEIMDLDGNRIDKVLITKTLKKDDNNSLSS